MIDLTPACRRTAQLLADVTDEQLTGQTPCEMMQVQSATGDLEPD